MLWTLNVAGMVFGLTFNWTHHIGGSGDDGPPTMAHHHSYNPPIITTDSSGSVLLASAVDSADIYFDGSLVLTRSSERTSYDLVVFKVTGDDGSLVWNATAIAGSGYVWPHSLATDAYDNLFILGICVGTSTFGPSTISASGQDYFLAKLSSSGVWQWATQAGTQDTDYPYSLFLAVTPTGDAFLTSKFLKFYGLAFGSSNVPDDNVEDASGTDVFVAKCSSDGTWAWVATSAKPVAGYFPSAPSSIALLPSGGVVIAGSYKGTLAFGDAATLTSAGDYDVFVAQVSDAGVWQWAASGGGSETDYPSGILVSADGSTISVTGTVNFASNGDGSYSGMHFGSIALTCGSYNPLYAYFGECGIGNPFAADLSSSGEWAQVTYTVTEYGVSNSVDEWAGHSDSVDALHGYPHSLAVLPSGVVVVAGSFSGTLGGCSNTCVDALHGYPQGDNGVCDDGGPGSVYTKCEEGTDCDDCGPRLLHLPRPLS